MLYKFVISNIVKKNIIMYYYLITVKFTEGPFIFGLQTPDESNLGKKVHAVVVESFATKRFVARPVLFQKKVIPESEFSALPPTINKWNSNVLEAFIVKYGVGV